jgi:hypothetical protein
MADKVLRTFLCPVSKLANARLFLMLLVAFSLSPYALKAEALYEAGNYRDGNYATSSSYKTALHWYVLAAERGDIFAQYNLGLIYKNGDGVARNDNAALKWWTLAAQQGHPLAALNVGVMYERGDTVSHDIATAIKWYSLAGAQSYVDRLIDGGASKPSVVGAWFPTNKKNCRIWNPMPQKNETALWSGRCSDGRVHGYGRTTWTWDTPTGGRDFRTTEGQSRNGIRFGEVKITYEDGMVYLGEVNGITGEPDGYGTITDTDGSTVSGQFRHDMFIGQASTTSGLGSALANGVWEDDKFSGEGTLLFENGDQYTGSIKGEHFHGDGTYIWANGTKYVGGFKEGKKTGSGTQTWVDGDKYSGDWEDDKTYGTGTYKWANGDKYVGGWKGDKSHGKGIGTWTNGTKYVGEWKNGIIDGQGIFTYPDGSTDVGSFTDGVFDGS